MRNEGEKVGRAFPPFTGRGGSAPLADSDLVTSARRDGEEIESEHTC